MSADLCVWSLDQRGFLTGSFTRSKSCTGWHVWKAENNASSLNREKTKEEVRLWISGSPNDVLTLLIVSITQVLWRRRRSRPTWTTTTRRRNWCSRRWDPTRCRRPSRPWRNSTRMRNKVRQTIHAVELHFEAVVELFIVENPSSTRTPARRVTFFTKTLLRLCAFVTECWCKVKQVRNKILIIQFNSTQERLTVIQNLMPTQMLKIMGGQSDGLADFCAFGHFLAGALGIFCAHCVLQRRWRSSDRCTSVRCRCCGTSWCRRRPRPIRTRPSSPTRSRWRRREAAAPPTPTCTPSTSSGQLKGENIPCEVASFHQQVMQFVLYSAPLFQVFGGN